jgi:hypothetical protein
MLSTENLGEDSRLLIPVSLLVIIFALVFHCRERAASTIQQKHEIYTDTKERLLDEKRQKLQENKDK